MDPEKGASQHKSGGAQEGSPDDAEKAASSKSDSPLLAAPSDGVARRSRQAATEAAFKKDSDRNTDADSYNYILAKTRLKTSSRISTLLVGFATIALVGLQHDQETPGVLHVSLVVVSCLLISVHLLSLMMSACILPYMEAGTNHSPHIRLKFYIDLSWFFSTSVGLVLFLVEIGLISFVKLSAVGYNVTAYTTIVLLVPILVIFSVLSYLLHWSPIDHTNERIDTEMSSIKHLLQAWTNDMQLVGLDLQKEEDERLSSHSAA